MGDTKHVGWTRILFCQRRTNIVHGRYPSEQHWEPVIVKHKKSVRYKNTIHNFMSCKRFCSILLFSTKFFRRTSDQGKCDDNVE
jgi:hypothetical protein